MNAVRYQFFLFAVACGSLVGGCAVTPPAPSVAGLSEDASDWGALQLKRQAVVRWGLEGRAAVAAGDQGWTASLRWNQDGARTELDLSGTFGVGGIKAVSDGGSLTIHTSKGEAFSGEEAVAMLQRTLGVSLPLNALRFWLLGVPAPGSGALTQFASEGATQGSVSELYQDGWRIAYDRHDFREPRLGLMPGRIVLEKDGVRVRVVVSRWRL